MHPIEQILRKWRSKTWPMLPAAVVRPSARERCSGAAERPTTPKTTPKPVPAMPSPTKFQAIGVGKD